MRRNYHLSEQKAPWHHPSQIDDQDAAVAALTRAQKYLTADQSEIDNYDVASAAEDLENVARFAFQHQYNSDWKQVLLLLRKMAPTFWTDQGDTNKYLSQAVELVDGEVGGVGADKAKIAAAKESRLSVAEGLGSVDVLAEILLCLQRP